jgi:hypothetical protein
MRAYHRMQIGAVVSSFAHGHSIRDMMCRVVARDDHALVRTYLRYPIRTGRVFARGCRYTRQAISRASDERRTLNVLLVGLRAHWG